MDLHTSNVYYIILYTQYTYKCETRLRNMQLEEYLSVIKNIFRNREKPLKIKEKKKEFLDIV